MKYLWVPSVRIHDVFIMPGNLANLFLQSAKKEGNLEEERRKQLPPAVLGVGAFVFRSSW